jgi:putative glutamine amidotransferase
VSCASSRRPLIAIPARFSASASALRYAADVGSRALMAAIYDAGGEPLLLHPSAADARVTDAEVSARLAFADGIVLPGGGDLCPSWSAQPWHPSLRNVDLEQDAFDLACARVAVAEALPLLAICRGAQVLTVSRGGRLVQDLDVLRSNHSTTVHEVASEPNSTVGKLLGARVTVSCRHHQAAAEPGNGLVTTARAEDGTIEAMEMPDHAGWLLAVQWHPEDAELGDPTQAVLFAELVTAAKRHRNEGNSASGG